MGMLLAVAAAVGCSLLLLAAWHYRSVARRATAAERLAIERRDRFLGEAAAELDAPLERLRGELQALTPRTATHERVGALVQSLDQLRTAVSELAQLPGRLERAPRDEFDLAALVREVVAAPPFSDRGPPVIVRTHPARVYGDRARLLNGLRILLWVLRREAQELVITVSSDEEHARVEIDTSDNRAAADALTHLAAFSYGLRTATAPPGTTLAARVASEVARSHGGRIRAAARPGSGERFIVELPTIGLR
jgi:two-component system sensor histidine kinase MtrB